MNPYRKLVKNTMIFAVGTFSSKVLVFLMMPFYTTVLSSGEYGLMDILVQTCNLLLPLATVGINNSVVRFGLEEGRDKRGIFSMGLCTILAGWGVLLLCWRGMDAIPFLSGYALLILAYVLASALHSLCNQFARAMGYIRLYAVDGILRTVVTILLNLTFLAWFHWGVEGYLLASIFSDLVASIFLVCVAKLWQYWSLASLAKGTWLEMLRYSVPLIPTTICTWIINISDRYMISYFLGLEANAPYSAANKIPTILIIVANIFTESWQISAVEQEKEEGKERFFSHVGEVYLSIACVTGSALILSARVIMHILTPNPGYAMAWKYIPVLVLATTFACLASFLNSIYVVQKRSLGTFFTTALAAIVNIALNLWLIPCWGVMGAGIATLCSYVVQFTVRLIHTRKYLCLRWDRVRLVLSLALLTLQAGIMTLALPNWIVWQGVLLCALIWLHSDSLRKAICKFC